MLCITDYKTNSWIASQINYYTAYCFSLFGYGFVTPTLQILVISGYLDVVLHIQIGTIFLLITMSMLI
jgi:hypothetical protein